jgi:hypothetical protein
MFASGVHSTSAAPEIEARTRQAHPERNAERKDFIPDRSRALCTLAMTKSECRTRRDGVAAGGRTSREGAESEAGAERINAERMAMVEVRMEDRACTFDHSSFEIISSFVIPNSSFS